MFNFIKYSCLIVIVFFWLTSDSELHIAYYYYITPALTFFYLYLKDKNNAIFCKKEKTFPSQAAKQYYEAYEKLLFILPVIIILASMIYIYSYKMIILCVFIILVSIKNIFKWSVEQCSIIKKQKYYVQK